MLNQKKMEENFTISVEKEELWKPEDTTIFHVQMIAVPVLIFSGILGNALSVWVLSASTLRGLSSSFYLSSLCVSDSGFLVSLLFVWLGGAGVDVYNREGWCQGITYVCYVTTSMSVWLVVAFTTERFVAVCYPFMRPTVCTVTRAKLVVGVLTVTSLVLYSYVLVSAGLITHADQRLCALKAGYESLGHIMNNVDTALTMLVPLVIIVVLNVKIIRCVRYVEKLRPQMHSIELMPKTHPNQLRVTKTLLIISSTFVLLNLPSYCIRALQYITVSEVLYLLSTYTLIVIYPRLIYN